MALQNFSGLFLPRPRTELTLWRSYGLHNLLIDAAGEKVAWVFRVPKTGPLERIGFRFNTVTTAADLKAGFQDVDPATGFPDGTIDQYRVVPSASVVSNTWIDTGIISSDGSDGGTKRSVTIGDLVAAVVEFDSAVGNLNISGIPSDSSGLGFANSAYELLYTSSWAKSQLGVPQLAIKYADGSYPYLPDVLPILSSATGLTYLDFNINSTPDEAGLYFQAPFPYKISHVWVCSNAAGDFQLVLYDAGDTVLRTISVDKDVRGIASASGGVYPFSAPIELTKNVIYRLVMKPTTTTNTNLRYMEVNAAAFLEHMDGGTAFYWTQRTDAGAWSQIATRQPWLGVVISALDDGVGGGGAGISRGRLQGGM
jgi:hypothetical protein